MNDAEKLCFTERERGIIRGALVVRKAMVDNEQGRMRAFGDTDTPGYEKGRAESEEYDRLIKKLDSAQLVERILEAKNLEQLCQVLIEFDDVDRDVQNTVATNINFGKLPNFGGIQPKDDLNGIYSWDETRVLVRAERGEKVATWVLIPREDIEDAEYWRAVRFRL